MNTSTVAEFNIPNLKKLVCPGFFDLEWQSTKKLELCRARPFPHLVLKDLFEQTLLEEIESEFDVAQADDLRPLFTAHESTYRSQKAINLQPATSLYFALIHSAWFIEGLNKLCGTKYLVPDPLLYGGGLHETRRGGSFDVHVDFQRHPTTGLKNELVMITYLNKVWDCGWGGQLELWDRAGGRPIRTVEPTFGTTLLMRRTDNSYHGHPHPFNPPDEIRRRSVAAYYYSNPERDISLANDQGAVFLHKVAVDRLKSVARKGLPPALWQLVRRLHKR